MGLEVFCKIPVFEKNAPLKVQFTYNDQVDINLIKLIDVYYSWTH